MFGKYPHLAEIDEIAPVSIKEAKDALERIAKLEDASAGAGAGKMKNAIGDFYLTNPIARASKIMAECAAYAKGANGATGATGADGSGANGANGANGLSAGHAGAGS